ncbi:uncharacterized protein [Littorina saxatilis]|uniref:uncharacterized protein n=1 Tax=Littorina saxatilis TaxID=31220 RepID=UPI0038B60E67
MANSELVVKEKVKKPRIPPFDPVGAEWQLNQCREFGLPFKQFLHSGDRKVKAGHPKDIVRIQGWHDHDPAMLDSSVQVSAERLFINHLNNTHYEIVKDVHAPAIEGSAVCQRQSLQALPSDTLLAAEFAQQMKRSAAGRGESVKSVPRKTLCQWVAPHLPPERSVTVEKKLLATVWLLANKETYRGVADRFGMNKGGLHRIVMTVCQVLTELRGKTRTRDVIQWPQRCDLARLAGKLAARAGFPDVVGAIDGTYIKIPGTRDENRDAYICRKGFPAMHLQVVCDKDLLFLDVFTGYAGSVHDSRVFRNSDLRGVLESDASKLPPEYHMIGDSAYPLRDCLLVPFRDNGHLTPVETAYNRAQARTRVDVCDDLLCAAKRHNVERAIGLLKGKFRRLKDLDMTNIREVPMFIFTACVLHNFIII